jgi:hypothetical protein
LIQTPPPPPDIAGTPLPGGFYTISPVANAMVCRTSGGKPRGDGSAHPIFALIATQVGLKLSVAELLALCDFDIADGPMMAGCEVRFSRALRIGETYSVSGLIERLERKSSQRLGLMDLFVHRLDLADLQGAHVASTTNTWVLPREKRP